MSDQWRVEVSPINPSELIVRNDTHQPLRVRVATPKDRAMLERMILCFNFLRDTPDRLMKLPAGRSLQEILQFELEQWDRNNGERYVEEEFTTMMIALAGGFEDLHVIKHEDDPK